jgi:hypothetical protein
VAVRAVRQPQTLPTPASPSPPRPPLAPAAKPTRRQDAPLSYIRDEGTEDPRGFSSARATSADSISALSSFGRPSCHWRQKGADDIPLL